MRKRLSTLQNNLCCFIGLSFRLFLELSYFTILSTFLAGCDVDHFGVTCHNARDARNSDVFIVSTVVTAPAIVMTIGDTCFRTIAANVVQPYRPATSTVAITNKLSAVAVCIAISYK